MCWDVIWPNLIKWDGVYGEVYGEVKTIENLNDYVCQKLVIHSELGGRGGEERGPTLDEKFGYFDQSIKLQDYLKWAVLWRLARRAILKTGVKEFSDNI